MTMEPKTVMQQKLQVEVNGQLFELLVPQTFKIYEGYEAALTMANIFAANMEQEKKMIEEKAEKAMPEKEEKVEEEKVDEIKS